MMRRLLIAIVGAAIAALGAGRLDAHRTAVSPFTFHRDVLPIIEAKCASCHAGGLAGAPPLLRYADARSATWPMRQVLSRGHTPPWFAEGQPPFKSPPSLSAAELNLLMTWATGGGPEGKPESRAPLPQPPPWPLGPPDRIMSAPTAASSGNQAARVTEFSWPANSLRDRRILAIDVLSQTPAIARRAEVIFRHAAGERVLGLWQPGERPAVFENQAGVPVDKDGSLILRMHYQGDGPTLVTDRPQLGLYFARGRSRVDSIELSAGGASAKHRFDRRANVVAIRPVRGVSGSAITVWILQPSGARRVMARLEFRHDWERRYVFETPVQVDPSDWLEVVETPSQSALWASLTGERLSGAGPATIALEYTR